MALFRLLVFLAAVIVLLALTRRGRVHPFVAIMAVAAAFGYVALFRISVFGRIFGAGFSAMVYTPGLVIVGAAFIADIAQTAGASDRLMAMLGALPRVKSNWIAAGLGLVAGLGASPAASFALLSPLLRPIGGKSRAMREGATVALGLALSASHGLAVLSPVAIAAISIIGADWGRATLFGVPSAVLLAGFAAKFARSFSTVGPAQQPVDQEIEAVSAVAQKAGTGAGLLLVLATMVPLLMLVVQSLGDIPSEPLGGEPRLDWIIAAGRPLILLLAGLGIMVVGMPRKSLALLADAGWAGHVLANVSGTLLIVCAAGGFQALCQQTGMADGLGARVLDWHVAAPLGLLLPFLATAVMKTLQGSSLLAAIASAGMVQPLLVPLGLGDTSGKALAALAVGAGAMTVSHVNDEFFWLVTRDAGFSPERGMATISLGTLLQGLAALAMLLLISLLVSHF